MPGFPFTSTHRPVGAHFLDFSDCPADDSLYDEARGPECLVHHCVDDGDSEDLDDYLLIYTAGDTNDTNDAEEETDEDPHQDNDDYYYYHYCDNFGDDYFYTTFFDCIFESQKEDEDYRHSTCPQYGHGRVELGAAVSSNSRKRNSEWNPKRNRGRKPRVPWGSLAERQRKKKQIRWDRSIT